MVFNSFTFIYICLIPCLLAVGFVEFFLKKHIVRVRLQNTVILLFSLLFYVWSGGISSVTILFVIILMNYVLGLLVKKIKKVALSVGIAANLFMLFYYKYFNLVLVGIEKHRDISFERIIAPLGISFVVFSCISYLCDIYKTPDSVCRNPFKFALYLSFFPKYAQGPIVKYKDFREQLYDRTIDTEKIVSGLKRFAVGLSKKVLIADILAKTSIDIFASMDYGLDAGTAWLGIFVYTIRLYMDFSGYSDMAIGISRMLGFEVKENFNFPYNSLSVSEFWRRWHISLGAWFREYLYFPLGGSKKGNVYLNLMIVFLATGVWHGAGLVYLLWGGMHGICIVITRFLEKQGKYERIPKVVRWAVTFFIVMIGWIAFNVPTVKDFATYLAFMFGRGHVTTFSVAYYIDRRLILLLLISVLGCILLPRIRKKFANLVKKAVSAEIISCTITVGLLVLCFITMVAEGYSPFLYFQY